MKDLPAIARYMRLPEELLRFPVELLHQGYEPNYLATYRPDELGGLDSKTLSRLKRSVVYESTLSDHKEQIAQALEKDGHWSDTVSQVINQCTSVSQVDAIAKNLRGKKTAKAFAEADPNIEKVGQAILLARGENIQDLSGWIQNQTGLSPEDTELLIPKVKRWLQLLLSEDAQLVLTLQRALLRNAVVSVKILPEPSKDTDKDSASLAASTPSVQSQEAPEDTSAETPAAESASSVLTETVASQPATPETTTEELTADESVAEVPLVSDSAISDA